MRKGYIDKLDEKLLALSKWDADAVTANDATKNFFICGATGSGKSTGSFAALIAAFFRGGFGVLCCVAKPDHTEELLRAAEACGRANSVIRVGPRGARFNFLRYWLAKYGFSGIGACVEGLMAVIEASRLGKSNSGGGENVFWGDAMRQALRNCLPLIYAAYGDIRIPDIIRFLASAPTSLEQARDPEWQAQSFMYLTVRKAVQDPAVAVSANDLQTFVAFWGGEWAGLDPRTRSNISISVSTVLDRFNHGILRDVFCTETDFTPEMLMLGAIVIIDMPVLSLHEDGAIGNAIVKFACQRELLGRNALPPQFRDRLVGIVADEMQYFFSPLDPPFLAASRSSRVCTVYATQSLPTLYAMIGGSNPKHYADMLLSNFGTKIFHASGCHETNRWAADTIGRSIQHRYSQNSGSSDGYSLGMNDGESSNWGSNSGVSTTVNHRGDTSTSFSNGSSSGYGSSAGRNRGRNVGSSHSQGFSEQMDYEIEPADFARYLRTGGPENRGRIDAIWFQSGRTFRASGRNYLKVEFQQ